MPPTLSAAQKSIAEKAGRDLFRYSKISEKHSVILQSDLNKLCEVYEEYERKAPPVGFRSAAHEVDDHMAQCEQLLIDKADCTELIDHLTVYNACDYLHHALAAKMRDLGDEVFDHTMRTQTKLDKLEPASRRGPEPGWPRHPNAAFQRLVGELASTPATVPTDDRPEALSDNFPSSLPSLPLEETDIVGKPRFGVAPAHISQYRENPASLQNQVFVQQTIDPHEEDSEIFRVSAILLSDQQPLFYLTFANDGNEAYQYLSDSFFSMLETCQQVMM